MDQSGLRNGNCTFDQGYYMLKRDLGCQKIRLLSRNFTTNSGLYWFLSFHRATSSTYVAFVDDKECWLCLHHLAVISKPSNGMLCTLLSPSAAFQRLCSLL